MTLLFPTLPIAQYSEAQPVAAGVTGIFLTLLVAVITLVLLITFVRR
jgi:hypothetical protein